MVGNVYHILQCAIYNGFRKTSMALVRLILEDPSKASTSGLTCHHYDDRPQALFSLLCPSNAMKTHYFSWGYVISCNDKPVAVYHNSVEATVAATALTYILEPTVHEIPVIVRAAEKYAFGWRYTSAENLDRALNYIKHGDGSRSKYAMWQFLYLLSKDAGPAKAMAKMVYPVKKELERSIKENDEFARNSAIEKLNSMLAVMVALTPIRIDEVLRASNSFAEKYGIVKDWLLNALKHETEYRI